MRSDFNVMRDVASHTRVAPDKRVDEICQLVDRINQEPEIKEEMDAWGMLVPICWCLIGFRFGDF